MLVAGAVVVLDVERGAVVDVEATDGVVDVVLGVVGALVAGVSHCPVFPPVAVLG